MNAEFSPKLIIMSGLLKDDFRSTEIVRMQSLRAVNVSRSVMAGKLFDFPLFLFAHLLRATVRSRPRRLEHEMKVLR